jgi:uncharacterized protein YndB with AHSA1/START domain
MAETSTPFVRIDRRFAAPPQALYDAWTQPDLLMRWWGPRGVTAVAAELDVRAGGRYAITMQPAVGEPFVVAGEYREVDPPNRIVKTWRYSGARVTNAVAGVVTVEFVAEGHETRIVLTQEFDEEPPDLAGRDKGWRSSLDRLHELLAG